MMLKRFESFILLEKHESFLKLQRAQIGSVNDPWDFRIFNGQHGEGVYAFKYGDKQIAEYYTKNGEQLHTFFVPKNLVHDASKNSVDYWAARKIIYDNPQHKVFIFKHSGPNLPTSKEYLITDPSIIELKLS